MAILIDKNSKIIVQGITGSEGSFHAQQCYEYGKNVVGGVTPEKGGQTVLDANVPVFNTCLEAKKEHMRRCILNFCTSPFAADAILEAADAEIELIVCITEGIPIQDMANVYKKLQSSKPD